LQYERYALMCWSCWCETFYFAGMQGVEQGTVPPAKVIQADHATALFYELFADNAADITLSPRYQYTNLRHAYIAEPVYALHAMLSSIAHAIPVCVVDK